MAGEVIVVYADQQPPESWHACIFIGGFAPVPGSSGSPWLIEVIELLRQHWTGDGRLVVLLPEPTSGVRDDDKLIDWYDDAVEIADVTMFWWPADADPRLMSTTLAAWSDSQRVVHGTPPHLPQSHYLLKYAGRHAVSTATTLAGMVSEILDKIGSGARRAAGEREVPLPVWQTDSFQRWYAAQTSAGNTLLGARQVWTFSAGQNKRFLLYWALQVRVYVEREDRIKANEVVISRPDISVVALYQRGANIDETTIVLVREFRSPASTPDGLVHELPGGSATTEASALDQAATETAEETGLTIEVRRIQDLGSRQVAATISAHHAHLFAAEITSDELARLRVTQSTPQGVTDDTEQTWTEIATFREIRENRLVDWATLGLIAEVVLDRTVRTPV